MVKVPTQIFVRSKGRRPLQAPNRLIAEINPRPAGPLDFPPPAGGGGVFEHPPVYLGSCAS